MLIKKQISNKQVVFCDRVKELAYSECSTDEEIQFLTSLEQFLIKLKVKTIFERQYFFNLLLEVDRFYIHICWNN